MRYFFQVGLDLLYQTFPLMLEFAFDAIGKYQLKVALQNQERPKSKMYNRSWKPSKI